MKISRPGSLFAALLLVFAAAACGDPGERTSASSDAPPAAEGAALFPVQQDGRWGYIDRTGRLVVAPRFERARLFVDGLGLVRADGKWGFIDAQGDPVIAPRFEDAWYFSGGVAPVQEDGEWIYVDRSGAPVDDASFVLDPSLLVEKRHRSADLQLARDEGRYGYQDDDGRFVIDPRFDRAWYFSDGLARVRVDGRWGFIDRRGELAIDPRFDLAWDFSDGLALVQVDGRYGYIDSTGTYVWEPTR